MSTKKTAVVAVRYETVEHVVACDLDGKQESINDYMERGLAVRWVTEEEAKRLMRQSGNQSLTDHDWMQIEQAANGCVSGISDEWPDLVRAIEKVRGEPIGMRETASWLRGFCEALMATRKPQLSPGTAA